MVGLIPPDNLPPNQQELWKKAERRRRSNATPLIIEHESIRTVTSGDGKPKSPIVTERVPVTTTAVVRPK